LKNRKREETKNVSPQKKDDFDVKANLRKLNKQSSSDASLPNYDYSEYTKSSSDVIASNGFTSGFEQTTNLEIKNLHSKLNSDISGLKDKVYETKDNLNSKISIEIDNVKKDFDAKLDKKFDEKIFYLACGVLATITTIIATFSYYPMINDVNTLKEKQIQFKDSLIKVNYKIDDLKK
jgi:hypothetical protein